MTEAPLAPGQPPHDDQRLPWQRLNRSAWLYLLHAGLLTSSLAIYGLFFNLLVLALGYPREFLGLLNMVSVAAAAGLSVPLWWLVTRIGLLRALLISAIFQAAGTFVFAGWPSTTPLLVAVTLGGAAAVLFQVSSPPFMMLHSDASSRDHLFSANAAINIGLAGVGSLIAGYLPTLFGGLLGADFESPIVYRVTFAVAGAGLVLSILPLLLIAQPRPMGTRQATRVDERMTRTRSSPWRPLRVPRLRLGALRLSSLPEPWHTMVREPGQIIKLMVPPFLISWGAALLIPYLNLFFKDSFSIPDTTLGQIFAALGIATGLAALAGPLLSTRIGKMGTIVLTQAVSIPFLLLLGFVPMLYVAVGAALARAALFNMGAPLFDAFAMERTDEAARPAVIGLINGAYSAGYLVAPLISTRVQERYGFTPLFVMTAMCYALAVLANYWFFLRRSRQPRITFHTVQEE